MKKIFLYISVAVLALGLSSCKKAVNNPEDSDAPDFAGEMTLMARIADEQTTKTSLSGNDTEGYKVLWSAGDEIKILVKGEIQEDFTYTLKEGAGTEYGVFTGPALPDGEYTAGYGNNFSVINGGLLSNNQSYSSDKNTCCAPMVADVTVVDGVAKVSDFRNICGLLRLDLAGNGVVKSIKVTTDQAQTGLIGLDEEGAASIRIYLGGKDVTLDCGENGVGLSSDPKSFYISMPKGDYTGMKIEITDINDNTQTKTQKPGKTLNIARAQITPVSLSVMLVPTTGTMPDIDGNPITWVQLWENGPKWATCDTDPVSSYDAYYVEDKATTLWGNNWRTPFIEEAESLAYYCDRSWDESTNTLIVTGRGLYSNNSIRFAPGEYWLAEYWELGAQMIMVNSTDVSINVSSDDSPRPIRPVVKE